MSEFKDLRDYKAGKIQIVDQDSWDRQYPVEGQEYRGRWLSKYNYNREREKDIQRGIENDPDRDRVREFNDCIQKTRDNTFIT